MSYSRKKLQKEKKSIMNFKFFKKFIDKVYLQKSVNKKYFNTKVRFFVG